MAADHSPASSPLPEPQDLLDFAAGPSSNNETSDSVQLTNSQPALLPHPTPNASPTQNLFYSVEYPGYVQTLPSSTAYAVRTLGGQSALDRAFGEGGRILELRLRPDNPFAHPVTGDVVTTNKLLVKVVTRRKKKTTQLANDAASGTSRAGGSSVDKGKGKEVDESIQDERSTGTYTAHVIGSIPKTVRFRSMADFQYQPDEDDYIVQMRHAMDRLDVDAIQSFDFEPLKENYGTGQPTVSGPDTADPDGMDIDVDPALSNATATKSQLKLIGPPLFSRQGISQHYNLKQSPMSVIHSTVDPVTGEETRRYIHKHRIKGSMAPISITWDKENVPTEPQQHILDVQNQAKPHLLAKMHQIFADRPVWSRVALMNQFPALESREILNMRVYIALVAYTFSDGAWRDTLVRFGYDPRKDPQARFLQRVYFRNTANEDSRRRSIVERRPGIENTTEAEASGNNPESHIFDGKTLRSETASFQLCDITDSLLVPLINDERSVRKEPDIADGWYTSREFALIKAVVRRKHFNLLQGKVISDKDCADLFVPGGLSVPDVVSHRASSSVGKKISKKRKGNRRPVAPERLMAAELEIALRKERGAAGVQEAAATDGSEVDESAMEEDE